MQQPTPKTALFAQWIQGRVIVVDQTLTTGNIWFVGSGVSGATDSSGYGRSPEAPFASINYAISQAAASSGDLILVLPGHTETVTAAAGLALNKAGLRIVGLASATIARRSASPPSPAPAVISPPPTTSSKTWSSP